MVVYKPPDSEPNFLVRVWWYRKNWDRWRPAHPVLPKRYRAVNVFFIDCAHKFHGVYQQRANFWQGIFSEVGGTSCHNSFARLRIFDAVYFGCGAFGVLCGARASLAKLMGMDLSAGCACTFGVDGPGLRNFNFKPNHKISRFNNIS